MNRELIVCDVETTGLDTDVHVPIEVAAINFRTGEVVANFVPWLDRKHLANANFQAMQINRYFERGVHQRMLGPRQTEEAYGQLFEALYGQTLGGANTRFDAKMLVRGYWLIGDEDEKPTEPWHYRLADVQSYAAGVWRLDPAEPPSLAEVCRRLEIENPAEHSALSDALVTAECFRRLQQYGLLVRNPNLAYTNDTEENHSGN